MRNFTRILTIISGVLILGLLLWNVYLINRLERLKKKNESLEYRIQILEGDVHILSYDLVTSRDSVRILNKSLKNCE